MYVLFLPFIISSFHLASVTSVSYESYLNKCLSSVNHKQVPGPEGAALKALHCKPWQNRSCCTWNTTDNIDQNGTLSLYGILLDQCPMKKKMSDKCKKHFERDTCFYECSPNVGPWIEKDTTRKTRKERFRNVPLCGSDCDEWFNDCREDFTCNNNWAKNWNWKNKGTSEMCPQNLTCKTFEEYFGNSKTFCEKLFDNSYKYEKDEKICMNLTPKGKHNEQVAENYAISLVSDASSTKGSLNFFCFSLLMSAFSSVIGNL